MADWDLFCAQSDDVWFWHTCDWLRYQRAYRPDLASQNCSFGVESGGRLIALAPLLREAHPGRCELGAGGGAAPAPAFAAQLQEPERREALEAMSARLDAIAAEHGAVRVSYRSSPLCRAFDAGRPPADSLIALGLVDVSLQTQVIDLGLPEDQLWKGLRKGHRADVRSAEKTLEAQLFDASSVSDRVFSEYRSLHAKAAGRVTRPAETFELMHQWIGRGDALLCAASRGGSFVCFALLIVYNSDAYYASGASDPEAGARGMAHLVQWRAIRELRARNVRRYEIGWQEQIPLPHHVASAKERSISAFKHGFGGRTVPLYQGEKYYSAAFQEEVAARRAQAFAASQEGA